MATLTQIRNIAPEFNAKVLSWFSSYSYNSPLKYSLYKIIQRLQKKNWEHQFIKLRPIVSDLNHERKTTFREWEGELLDELMQVDSRLDCLRAYLQQNPLHMVVENPEEITVESFLYFKWHATTIQEDSSDENLDATRIFLQFDARMKPVLKLFSFNEIQMKTDLFQNMHYFCRMVVITRDPQQVCVSEVRTAYGGYASDFVSSSSSIESIQLYSAQNQYILTLANKSVKGTTHIVGKGENYFQIDDKPYGVKIEGSIKDGELCSFIQTDRKHRVSLHP